MMFSRLLIARQLLKDDGVIFISIDDNEVHHLRKLCDEVFGEENFISSFIWKRRQNVDSRSKNGASVDHEYILCFRKLEPGAIKGAEKDLTKYANPDNDPKGDWMSADMTGLATIDQRPNLHYDLEDPKTGFIYKCPPTGWRYEKKRMLDLIQKNEVLFPTKPDGRPRRKKFVNDLESDFTGFSTILKTVFNTQGTRELRSLFDEKEYFDFPKPKELLKELIKQGINDDGDIILDFFAGSGTTGQAVSELNAEDGRNRKFILVQIPEAIDEGSEASKAGYKKISDITIERNKRVVETLIEEKKKQAPDLFTNGHKDDALKGLGFKVFKLVKSTFPRVEFAPDVEKTDEENIELLKKYISEKEAQLVNAFNRDDLITEILIKNGFTLNYTIQKQPQFQKNDIFLASDGEKEALICLDYVLDPETVAWFKTHTETKFICLERALDTTKKYSLKQYMGNMFNAF